MALAHAKTGRAQRLPTVGGVHAERLTFAGAVSRNMSCPPASIRYSSTCVDKATYQLPVAGLHEQESHDVGLSMRTKVFP